MNTESRGISIAFVAQMAVVVVGWMITAFIIRQNERVGIAAPSHLAHFFLHHGLWLALLPVGWAILAVNTMKTYSRWSPVVLFVIGPAIPILFIITAVRAVAYSLGVGTTAIMLK